jgi:hypothetical protein
MAVREHGLFRLVDHPSPDVAKGGCYYSYDTGPGVDTGILIDFEGTLFFSLNTIKEMAEVAGFSVNEEAAQLEHDLAFLAAEVERQNVVIVDLSAQLEAVGLAVAHAANVQAAPEVPKTRAKKEA